MQINTAFVPSVCYIAVGTEAGVLVPTQTLRIGLIADTHDATDPVGLIQRLGEQGFDRLVHLGDIAASPLVVKMVRQFKCGQNWQSTLTSGEWHQMMELREQGKPPVVAYLEARIAHNPTLRQQRHREARESYQQIVTALAKIPGLVALAGNVDRSWLRHPDVAAVFERSELCLKLTPELVDEGGCALLFWPSIRPRDQREIEHLDEEVAQISNRLRDKRQVVIFSHEQLFRGPMPEQYLRRVARAGLAATTIPHYEPSPTRRQIISLLRALPLDTQTCVVSGHVHDCQEVIQAGISYLQSTPGGGLAYRIGGPGSGRTRRGTELFCVPANQIGELTIDETGFQFNLVG